MSMKEIGAPVSGKNSELVVIILIIILSIVGAIWTVSTIYSKLESVEEYQAQEEALMMMEDHPAERKLEDKDIEQLREKLEALQSNSKTILNQQQELEKTLLQLGETSGTDN